MLHAVGQPLLQAQGINVTFDGRGILNDVDMAIHARQIVTLIGPNGAGKTTLLRVLLGLVPCISGRVTRARRLRIGYMPQRLRIDPAIPLTVKRFLELNNRTSRSAVRVALEEVGGAHVENSQVGVLSGGEFQRILLARALLRRPGILVLDEPAQGVDVGGQGDLYRLIAAIRDRHGCAVLMISQDLHLVMEASDSVICLNHHVCCTGQPEAVSQHPEYLKLFGAERLGGIGLYKHHHDHVHDLQGEVVPLNGEPNHGGPDQRERDDVHG